MLSSSPSSSPPSSSATEGTTEDDIRDRRSVAAIEDPMHRRKDRDGDTDRGEGSSEGGDKLATPSMGSRRGRRQSVSALAAHDIVEEVEEDLKRLAHLELTAQTAVILLVVLIGLPAIPVTVAALVFYNDCGRDMVIALLFTQGTALVTILLTMYAMFGATREYYRENEERMYMFRMGVLLTSCTGMVVWVCGAATTASYLFTYKDTCAEDYPELFTTGVVWLTWTIGFVLLMGIFECVARIIHTRHDPEEGAQVHPSLIAPLPTGPTPFAILPAAQGTGYSLSLRNLSPPAPVTADTHARSAQPQPQPHSQSHVHTSDLSDDSALSVETEDLSRAPLGRVTSY